MLSNTRNAIGGSIRHYSLWNDDITLVAFIFHDLCGQIVLVEAVVDIVDDCFNHGMLCFFYIGRKVTEIF